MAGLRNRLSLPLQQRQISQRLGRALPAHLRRRPQAPQTAGRSPDPKRRQRFSAVSWLQRAPAGFPCGMPGIGDEIDGAMQQAAQPGRQAKESSVILSWFCTQEAPEIPDRRHFSSN